MASKTKKIVARQCVAARGLLGWTQKQLAQQADVTEQTVIAFETEKRETSGATVFAIRHALETGGVDFIPENGGGVGVRLKARTKPAD